MGQQESSYKKFDDRLRRRRRENTSKKEATKEEEEEVTTTTTSLVAEKEKVKAGFSLASLRWRPSLVVGSLNPPSDGDLSSWPGWYHGWCNKAQVRQTLLSTPLLHHSMKLENCIFYHQHRYIEIGRHS